MGRTLQISADPQGSVEPPGELSPPREGVTAHLLPYAGQQALPVSEAGSTQRVVTPSLASCRGDWIRTSDLLNPIRPLGPPVRTCKSIASWHLRHESAP